MKHVFLLTAALLTAGLTNAQSLFNYKKAIAKGTSLAAYATTINRTTGEVVFTGGDTRGPATPGLTFTWVWGDGTRTTGFFPQTKTYTDVTKNYIAQVIANYSATEKDTVDVPVFFGSTGNVPIAIPAELQVLIPSQPVSFANRPATATYYTNDRLFSGNVNRQELAYTLSVFNTIEVEMANNDVLRYGGKLQHVMLRDSSYGGAYALWFTDPMALAVGDALLTNLDFSSLAHELGHNITLNSPASYIFGGKIDGNANAIFSEAMAQIFQHSVGYVVLNDYARYGFSSAYASLMKQWFVTDFATSRRFYEQYLSGGKAFASWNNPATPADETLFTFGTIAYKFCEYAEQQNKGFLVPVKRLMQFLQRFNADWHRRYDQHNNTPAADAFRATMMVAALSHAFQQDLRADFRALNFPVSDVDWAFLNPSLLAIAPTTLTLPAPASTTTVGVTSTAASWNVASSQPWLTLSAASGSGNQSLTVTTTANPSVTPRTAVITLSASGFTNQTVAVTQAGVAPTLTTSVQSLTVDAAGGSTSVAVTSNTTWNVAGSQPWVTVSPGTATGNATFTITTAPNPATDARTATITLSASGVTALSLPVLQRGLPITALVSPLDESLRIYPNPASNRVRIEGLPVPATLRLYNLGGTLVHQADSHATSYALPVEHLPAGTYYLQVSSQQKTAARRLLKLP